MPSRKGKSKKELLPEVNLNTSILVTELRQIIDEAKHNVAVSVNKGIIYLYWRVGKRINIEILKETRAEYGKKILATVSQQLTEQYGQGFSYSALTRMINFSNCFPDHKIIATLSQTLSWSHFQELLSLKNSLQREFYCEMCRIERWSVRTLRNKIDGMLYERTALSKKPDKVIKNELRELREEDKLSPEIVFRDPCFLDFLGLKDHYIEKDIEDAILRELELFLLEIGNGFAFLSRQKRIQLDNDDYYIDLLFYHRGLNRLIAIDLKLGDFKAEYKGQMELYLRWLNKYERQPNEKEPLGIILCAGKKQELIELLELNQSGIHVAEYLTELPDRKLLKEKLHKVIEQNRLEEKNIKK